MPVHVGARQALDAVRPRLVERLAGGDVGGDRPRPASGAKRTTVASNAGALRAVRPHHRQPGAHLVAAPREARQHRRAPRPRRAACRARAAERPPPCRRRAPARRAGAPPRAAPWPAPARRQRRGAARRRAPASASSSRPGSATVKRQAEPAQQRHPARRGRGEHERRARRQPPRPPLPRRRLDQQRHRAVVHQPTSMWARNTPALDRARPARRARRRTRSYSGSASAGRAAAVNDGRWPLRACRRRA